MPAWTAPAQTCLNLPGLRFRGLTGSKRCTQAWPSSSSASTTGYRASQPDWSKPRNASSSAHGVDTAAIHEESFDATPKAGPPQVRISGPPSAVTLTANGRTTTVSLARNSDTFLDAAMRLRDDLPYSCMSGSCGSCLAHVRDGKVDQGLRTQLPVPPPH